MISRSAYLILITHNLHFTSPPSPEDFNVSPSAFLLPILFSVSWKRNLLSQIWFCHLSHSFYPVFTGSVVYPHVPGHHDAVDTDTNWTVFQPLWVHSLVGETSGQIASATWCSVQMQGQNAATGRKKHQSLPAEVGKACSEGWSARRWDRNKRSSEAAGCLWLGHAWESVASLGNRLSGGMLGTGRRWVWKSMLRAEYKCPSVPW